MCGCSSQREPDTQFAPACATKYDSAPYNPIAHNTSGNYSAQPQL
jgi:hypothetical protein